MAEILVVENERALAEMVGLLLRRRGHSVTLLHDAVSAREHVRHRPCDLVVCDLRLRRHDGDELLAALAQESSSPATIVMTADTDPDALQSVVALGAAGIVIKPFEPATLLSTIDVALRKQAEIRELRVASEESFGLHGRRLDSLMRTLQERDAVIAAQRSSNETSVMAACRAMEFRGSSASRHIERFTGYCLGLAEVLRLPADDVARLREAAPWHDIGMVAAPASVLSPAELTPDERTQMRSHTTVGYGLLAGTRTPHLAAAAEVALTHHERWDGTGYPRALRGEEIPLFGRIAAVADTFDALTSARSYRPMLPLPAASEELRRVAGTQLDPTLVNRFLERVSDMVRIGERFSDFAPGA